MTLPKGDLAYGYRDSVFKHPPLRDRLIITEVVCRLSRVTSPCLAYGNLAALVGPSPAPADVRRAIISTRRAKLPEVEATGSAGSFFKNPVVLPEAVDRLRLLAAARGISTDGMPAFPVDGGAGVKLSAAWLIDRAGWKGVVRGNVGTWPSQPLVIVNLTGRATGAEVAALARDISADISEKFGVELHPEVEYL